MEISALIALRQLAVTASGGEKDFVAPVITVIATFLVVIWVLNKYAFGPILSVIDERRDKIAADLNKAEECQKQAETLRAETEERLRNVESEARERMQDLINEGKKVAKSIQDKAQQDAEALAQKAQQSIALETEKARVALKEEVVSLTLMATEKLIGERLDDEKHRGLISDFISEIERN